VFTSLTCSLRAHRGDPFMQIVRYLPRVCPVKSLAGEGAAIEWAGLARLPRCFPRTIIYTTIYLSFVVNFSVFVAGPGCTTVPAAILTRQSGHRSSCAAHGTRQACLRSTLGRSQPSTSCSSTKQPSTTLAVKKGDREQHHERLGLMAEDYHWLVNLWPIQSLAQYEARNKRDPRARGRSVPEPC
jgi:hypothetical protein